MSWAGGGKISVIQFHFLKNLNKEKEILFISNTWTKICCGASPIFKILSGTIHIMKLKRLMEL